MREFLSEIFTENLSYKLVALFISLILWLSVLSRRDFVLNQKIEIDLKVGAGQVLVAQTADHVKVRVSGARQALKRFMEESHTLEIDISDKGTGLIDVDIPIRKIEVPFGVKVLGVRPNLIRAEVAGAAKKEGSLTDNPGAAPVETSPGSGK